MPPAPAPAPEVGTGTEAEAEPYRPRFASAPTAMATPAPAAEQSLVAAAPAAVVDEPAAGEGPAQARQQTRIAPTASNRTKDATPLKVFRDRMKVHVESGDAGQQSALKITMAELRERVRHGSTKPAHLVWWKGLPSWLALEEASRLHPAFAAAVGPTAA